MVKKLGLKLKEQKGFTLIELLAVIVILGIIAAIAIPAIGNVIKNSQDKANTQEALLLIDAAKLYVADNDPKVTTYLTIDGTTAGLTGTSITPVKSLANYVDRVKDKSFAVKAEYTAGKYTYSIAEHDASGSEADLLSK